MAKSEFYPPINQHVIIVILILLSLVCISSIYWILSDSGFEPKNLGPTAAGIATVDVMVLYNKAAAKHYNHQAETRINHLIDVSNQIYQDSGVNLALRLVHAEEVNYESGYSTGTAIRHITNQTHPAFQGVRSLRAEYGADLVVLMRPYSEDGYCGLAWIGGSGTNGDFGASGEKDYGYSHVSIDCGTYVLSHELGHNMGLNHSRRQKESPGTFDFSLGHGIDNDFVTVMAYSSTFNGSKVKLFSSPSLDCGTSPCGIDRNHSDGADAVYTLNITSPQVARYFESVVQIPDGWSGTKFDTDGNGTADIVLHHPDGSWHLNTMNGPEVTSVLDLSLEQDPAWRMAGREDYNGDGLADILIRNSSTGAWKVNLLDGNHIIDENRLMMTQNLDWSVAASGDFDGDGMGDVLLRNSDGRWYQYFINGTAIKTTARPSLPEDPDYVVASAGDFNGDGKTDILLRKPQGGWHLYLIDGDVISADGSVSIKKSPDWHPVGSGDFTGNEIDDLLLRYKDGNWLVYSFEDFNVNTSGFLEMTSDPDWQPGPFGDYDGNGSTNILLRSRIFGNWILHDLSPASKQSNNEVALTTDLDWTPDS